MTVLRVSHATKAYGLGRHRRNAIWDCSFDSASGEIIGIIGPNGAGKTTLLRMIAGETSITSGAIHVCGIRAGSRTARRVVGYVGDPPLLPGELTGSEWLKYLSCHRSSHPRTRTATLQWSIELADLGEFAGHRISDYSRGMMQRLALAGAAVAGSRLLVLDEALSGIDPLVAKRMRGTLCKLSASGWSVLLASHDLSVLERVATRVLVLWQGRLVSDVCLATLARSRVAELSISGSGLKNRDRLVERFEGSAPTADGISVPLSRGTTVEHVIAVCRSERIPVAASRVRYRSLEDILARAAAESEVDSRFP